MSRKFFVGGNFKMNGSKDLITKIVDGLNKADLPTEKVEVVLAPPFPYLGLARELAQPSVEIAAQNIYLKGSGAFTGEVSAEMLKDVGAQWVILGHSERRALFGESSDFIAQKTKYAIDNGVKVILCVGESKEERDAGKTIDVVNEQLNAVISVLTPEQWGTSVIAYEPVWAIGTGLCATPDDADEVHTKIRELLASKVSKEVADSTRIIYGGSVSASSAPELSLKKDIDGFLVGGASLKPEFADIVKSGLNKAQA